MRATFWGVMVGVSLWCLAAPSPAHAYLDPGTGSMILQVVIGAVVGAMVTARLYWARIKTWFRGFFK